jgi:hypothetical protein
MKRSILISVGLLACVILATAALLLLRRAPRESGPITARGGSGELGVTIRGIPYYLQNDPQWGAEPIGGSNERMASVGCTVSALAMGLTAVGHPVDPLTLSRELKQRGGFTANGFVIWQTVSEVTGGRVKVELPTLSHEAIDAELMKNRPVIAKILLRDRIQHWVLIVGKQGTDYLVMDPLNDEKSLLHLSDRSSAIHAIRVLKSG